MSWELLLRAWLPQESGLGWRTHPFCPASPCQTVLDSGHCSSLIHLEMSQSFLQARLIELRVVNSFVL